MTDNIYDVGDKVRTQGTFQDLLEVDTDPSTITFKFKDPASTITTYIYGTDAELVKSATGVYYVDLILSQEGEYHYRFEGTGSIHAADEVTFRAQQSEFFPV